MAQNVNRSSAASPAFRKRCDVFAPHLKDAWLCVYVYFNHPQEMDRFILNGLHPLVAMLRERERIRRYFFIRYVDSTGYHIRFRVFQPIRKAREQIRGVLSSAIADYFVAEPLQSMKSVPGFRVPGSLHFENYAPEYERYGGQYGMSIAERHFESSSDVVIEALQLTRDNPSGKILLTLQLFIAMAYAAGLKDTRMNRFFDIIFAPRIEANKEIVNTAQSLFSSNKHLFLQAISNADATLSSRPVDTLGVDLLSYYRKCHETFGDIRKLIDLHDDILSSHYRMLFPYLKMIKDKEEAGRDYYKLLGFLVSCLHMTANRLGWQPQKEHILYGVLSLALAELYGPAYKIEQERKS